MGNEEMGAELIDELFGVVEKPQCTMKLLLREKGLAVDHERHIQRVIPS